VFIKACVVDQTQIAKDLELTGYALLQRQLSSDRVPIYIVDISDLEVASFNIDGQTGKATPREPLRKIIEAVAAWKPRAIGVDIDFSPDQNGYITPRDPEFFQSILDLRRKQNMPIFLGIKRSEALRPAVWLGSEDYKALAASITIPKQDPRKMPRWIPLSEHSECEPPMSTIRADEHSKCGRTMSAGLADTFREDHCKFAKWMLQGPWIKFIEHISERKLPGVEVPEFLVDYSPLDSLMGKQRLQTIKPVVIQDQGRQLRSKVVLIGDGTLGKASDTFVIPGRPQPVPGIYLHASAAYTLAMAPLYELTLLGRIVVDFLLLMSILLAITSIHLYKNMPGEDKTHWWEDLLTLLVMIVVIVGGMLFIRSTCLIWSDFIVALGGLLLHPRLEKFFWSLLNKIPKILHAIVSRPDQ